MTVLLDQYRSKRTRIVTRASSQIGALWQGLPNYDDPQLFVAPAVTVARGAQGAAASLTGAYLTLQIAQYSDRRPRTVGFDIRSILGDVRNGVPSSDVYARPFTTLRVALSEGVAFADAVDRGLARATQAIATDVALAARETNRAVLTRSSDIVGYRRELSGSGCELCAGAADEIYSTDQLMPIHPTCQCGYVPIVRGFEADEPAPPDVPADLPLIETVDHGELGPLLWNAAHQFNEI